ncbi:uncharacterized protein LOC123529245 isoform X2 [Mercenaria mercenaria]|nr:uncharacterized protein LOC123529245 isoform X2 [Mercenaria mercenaria]XP_053378176.1 uncharacterized protein LOC123529245 isoform X2 [Mercenaria mercenaria]
MPQAPRDIYSKMDGSTPVITWSADPKVLYGLEYLRHILLKIVQSFTHNGTFMEDEYILLNVSGKSAMTSYSYNCSTLKPGAYKVNATLWFIGKLRYTTNGHLLADVDEQSRSRSKVIPKHDIVPELRKAKLATESCICSSQITTIKIFSTESGTGIRTQIQASGLPNDTKVEVQLVSVESNRKHLLLESWIVPGNEIQNVHPYIRTLNVSGGNSYYVRVKRHCQRKYFGVLSCGKEEADVIRSQHVFIQKGSFHLPISAPTEEQGGTGIYQVLQITVITFLFGICIFAETALIIKLSAVIFCPQKKTTSLYKRSTYVKLDSKGQTETKLTTSKRVAIIHTKDSCKHVEKVKRINDELRKRGIDSVLFDESTSVEMRANWIDAAENVVTDFEVIMFVITPFLYNICKKEETIPHPVKEETNEVGLQMLTRFPAVVLNALKARSAWTSTDKAKIVSICVAETKHEYKQLSLKMRQEHPFIFKDKIYFNSLRHVDDSSIRKQIRKVICLLKSSK